MKADQKWNIAAQAGLGLIVALAILTTWGLMPWIVPKAKNSHRKTLEAIPSRIADVDGAKESANYAKQQILVQSGTAMLAQANLLSQSALRLLQ